jgi:hypothetical protein
MGCRMPPNQCSSLPHCSPIAASTKTNTTQCHPPPVAGSVAPPQWFPRPQTGPPKNTPSQTQTSTTKPNRRRRKQRKARRMGMRRTQQHKTQSRQARGVVREGDGREPGAEKERGASGQKCQVSHEDVPAMRTLTHSRQKNCCYVGRRGHNRGHSGRSSAPDRISNIYIDSTVHDNYRDTGRSGPLKQATPPSPHLSVSDPPPPASWQAIAPLKP